MVIYHPLVQNGLREILTYYESEADIALADRFFEIFLARVADAEDRPHRFHPVPPVFRRTQIPGFPHYFLFRETDNGIRVSVLRHDKRHPRYGLKRR